MKNSRGKVQKKGQPKSETRSAASKKVIRTPEGKYDKPEQVEHVIE